MSIVIDAFLVGLVTHFERHPGAVSWQHIPGQVSLSKGQWHLIAQGEMPLHVRDVKLAHWDLERTLVWHGGRLDLKRREFISGLRALLQDFNVILSATGQGNVVSIALVQEGTVERMLHTDTLDVGLMKFEGKVR